MKRLSSAFNIDDGGDGSRIRPVYDFVAIRMSHINELKDISKKVLDEEDDDE